MRCLSQQRSLYLLSLLNCKRSIGLGDSGDTAIDGFKIAATFWAAFAHRWDDKAVSTFGTGATGDRPLQYNPKTH
jgi:hypothetical protein